MLFALVPLDQLGAKELRGLQGQQPMLVGADPVTGANWHNCDDPWGCYLQVIEESGEGLGMHAVYSAGV